MEFLEELLLFFGKWHPLIVHLPIGILVVSFLFALFSRRPKYHYLIPAIPFTLWIGAIAAVLAAVTGFLLSRSGGYEVDTLEFHQWLGIITALMAVFCAVLYTEIGQSFWWIQIRHYRFGVLSFLLLVLIATGYFGGTLTHGEGYIRKALPSSIQAMVGLSQEDENSIHLLDNAQETKVFEGVIQPILLQRCQSCHGAKKQEGQLALHTLASVVQGGENGPVIRSGQLDESELYARLILPEGHEGRMPPKGRTPITPEQIQLIAWWIETGASFEAKAKELAQSETIVEILHQLESGKDAPNSDLLSQLPEPPAVPSDLVDQLQAKGIKILPLYESSRWVSVHAINYPELSDQDIEDLEKFKANIVQLKLGRTAITDQALEKIGQFPHVMKLHLEHTNITDQGLRHLQGMPYLTYINLFGVHISQVGLDYLQGISSLKQKYTSLGVGNDTLLKLPFLPSDTMRY
jgi:uncharacterized membrane protein